MPTSAKGLKVAFASALFIFTGLLTGASASSAAPGDPVPVPNAPVPVGPTKCYPSVENPHPSTGAGTGLIIAKARFYCPSGYTHTYKSWIGNIYRCSRQPDINAAEATWTRDSDCLSVATNSSTDDGGAVSVSSNTTVTRYIPRSGGATRIGGSYYIACLRGYNSDGTPFATASGVYRA